MRIFYFKGLARSPKRKLSGGDGIPWATTGVQRLCRGPFLALLLIASLFPGGLHAALSSPRSSAHAADSGSAEPESPPTVEDLLREAARVIKRRDIEKIVREARALAEGGASIQTTDEYGRTPLHGLVIGATQVDHKKTQKAYRELLEILIDLDADMNAEDQFGNTPLDWAEAGAHDGLRYLLRQAGARRGSAHNEAERMLGFLTELRQLAARKDFAALSKALQSDVPGGVEIWLRLRTPVHSKVSRVGDVVEAEVIAPVFDGDRVVMQAGTKVRGTVLSVRAARNRFTRAELAIDFTNFIHADGTITRIASNVVMVDNARESTSAGRIQGVPFPNEVVGRWTLGLRGLGFVMPGVSEVLRWSTNAYNLTLAREIDYPEGAEMILRVSVPEQLNTKLAQQGWKRLEASSALVRLVQGLPHRVRTPSGEDSDITNLLFLGSAEDIETGFRLAGWQEAKDLSLKTGARTALAALRKSGYQEAPFSLLTLNGNPPDYEYQKDLNTIAKRHHLRIFRMDQDYQGHPVWLASATHDIGVGVGRSGTQWYHLIHPEIDKERQKIADDLLHTGVASAFSMVNRPDAPREAKNGTGDDLRTDGRVLVLHLLSDRHASNEKLEVAGD